MIKKSFWISLEELETFKYLGLNAQQIKIDQSSYINELKEVEISQEKQNNKFAQLSKYEAQQLQGLAGQLNWIGS